MNYDVLVTPTADAEAMESFDWYAQRSAAVAERWYAFLNKAIAGLAENPVRSHESDADSAHLGFEVRILYTIRGDAVWVLRIRHSAQGPLDPNKGS